MDAKKEQKSVGFFEFLKVFWYLFRVGGFFKAKSDYKCHGVLVVELLFWNFWGVGFQTKTHLGQKGLYIQVFLKP